MSKQLLKKQNNFLLRKRRVKAKITTDAVMNGQRPRLAVNRSLKHIIAQVIDDSKHQTLAYATSEKLKLKGTKTEIASAVGKEIAKMCQSKNITKVVFDRSGHIYHGRVKALADAARENGLEF